ncbi:flavin monoamine oxidase family protein [Candidatus Paracaedibacter symbiosus]|uniref:flavin monoamine oxidase family protein n=1 Tax=Candidatus Paracaedibacter symbiosus TaxID=244582 RepID=UPI000A03C74F|nr:NAD(P)/FAD-dependent oxidoreductase [Candidatus Paracaedibacter symbiosus]
MYPKVQNQLRILKEKDKGIKKHIYIIGAGIAGLIAGYELKKLGHKVTLLEASHRVGGRIFTYRFGNAKDAPYGELGAMRFPLSHEYTLHYIHEFQLNEKMKPFIDVLENENSFLSIKQNALTIKDFLDPNFINNQRIHILKGIISTFVPEEIAKLINAIDTQDIDLLQKKDYPVFIKVMEEFAQTLGRKNPSINSILKTLIKTLSNKFFYIERGMDQLPLKIADQLSSHILYNTEVCQISNLNNKAEITILQGDKYETLSCDYLICTLPFSSMRNMSLKNFSSKKLEAIHQLKYINACKILLLCKRRFWESNYNIRGGVSITDGIVRKIYYPSTPDGPGVLLNYTAGNNASHLSNLTHDKRIALAQKTLGLFHKEIYESGMILDSTSIAWDKYKWSKGGFSFMWSDYDSVFGKAKGPQATEINPKSNFLFQLYKSTIQPEGRIFFAGEHCSTFQGWIQGAIISALECAQAIVSH